MDEIALLEGLLQRYSPTGQENEAVSFLVEQMRGAGCRAFVDEVGNAVSIRGDGPNEVMLLGHIDTVPGSIEIRQDGDLLYGRGAVDAKGPLACFAAAANRVDPGPDWRITVIGAVGEEGDSRGAWYIRDRYTPQALIIGEPSKWDRITLGFKGSVWFNYSLRRPLAHTAGKNEGVCETAVQFWNTVRQWCVSHNTEDNLVFTQLSPSLRAMCSETDGFYDTAHLEVGLRLPPGVSVQTAVEKLAELKGEAELTVVDRGVNAFRAEKNTPLVRAFLNSIRKAGGTPSFSLKTGTSDMNIVAPAWGCATVAYGPGDSGLDHTPDERTSLNEYRKSIDVLADALFLITR
jgi:[amino group carrier protein]-lysine/ornithine hydrolase